MVPPAPGRFSTTSGWPLTTVWKPLDRFRDKVSAAPPAPTGTRSRTGRSGHCAADCAKAGMAASAATARAASPVTWPRTTLAKGIASPPRLNSIGIEDIDARHPAQSLLRQNAEPLKKCQAKARLPTAGPRQSDEAPDAANVAGISVIAGVPSAEKTVAPRLEGEIEDVELLSEPSDEARRQSGNVVCD